MNNLHFTNFQARQEGTGTYRYRFTRTVRPTTYRFRARVVQEPSWPMQTGTSPVRAVRVRPTVQLERGM